MGILGEEGGEKEKKGKKGPRAIYDPKEENGIIRITIDKVVDEMWDDVHWCCIFYSY